jgi:UDPglucose--hexose-1-phosphate uridylyltransferase
MSELRYEPLRDLWVLFSEERRRRPLAINIVEHKDLNCPFCEGREKETPPEVWAIREKGKPDTPGWKVRVVPNKYPALSQEAASIESDPSNLFIRRRGYGYHEVILECPDHDKDLVDLSSEQLFLVLLAYRERMRALYGKSGIKYVQIFRNWGALGGASLSHPHSQVLALAQVPIVPQRELNRLMETRLLCQMEKEERSRGERFLTQSEKFSAFLPFASRFAYETVILPKDHRPDFRETTDEELKELGDVLRRVIGALKKLLGNISYNLVLHSLPNPNYHWHIEITPRIAGWAGFELGTGYFINTVLPEKAAEELRDQL